MDAGSALGAPSFVMAFFLRPITVEGFMDGKRRSCPVPRMINCSSCAGIAM